MASPPVVRTGQGWCLLVVRKPPRRLVISRQARPAAWSAFVRSGAVNVKVVDAAFTFNYSNQEAGDTWSSGNLLRSLAAPDSPIMIFSGRKTAVIGGSNWAVIGGSNWGQTTDFTRSFRTSLQRSWLWKTVVRPRFRRSPLLPLRPDSRAHAIILRQRRCILPAYCRCRRRSSVATAEPRRRSVPGSGIPAAARFAAAFCAPK
jgi:hypothetical protein